MRIRDEPLWWFLVAGALLFALDAWFEQMPDERVIAVGEPELLEFIRQRGKLFAPGEAEARLARLTPAGLETLIDDYAHEEILYREALTLGLDDDYVTKRRLVQKMEQMAEGFAADDGELSEAAIDDYYRTHRDDYRALPG